MIPHPVFIVRNLRGYSVKKLAELARVSEGTINRIENPKPGKKKRTNITVAEAVAGALECPIEHLFDIEHDLTEEGRHAGTGCPIKGRVARVVTTEVTFIGLQPHETLCLKCFCATRIGTECIHCGEPL